MNPGARIFLFFCGEVYDPDPRFLSEFAHRDGLSFCWISDFKQAVRGFASGNAASHPPALPHFFTKDSLLSNADGERLLGLLRFLES